MNKSRKFAAHHGMLVLLLLCGLRASAQIGDEEDGMYLAEPKAITVGLLGGASFCQVDGDNYAGYHRVAANFGGIGYVKVYKHVALSFELLYSQKGAKSDHVRYSPLDSTTLITKYNIKLSYAEIPLMINYFDKHKSHFGLGVSYGRLVKSDENMTALPAYSVDFTKYPFKKDSYGIVAAASMHLWKGFFMNLRFQYDLSPLRTVSPPGLARAQRQFNNVWVVRLMYLFI